MFLVCRTASVVFLPEMAGSTIILEGISAVLAVGRVLLLSA